MLIKIGPQGEIENTMNQAVFARFNMRTIINVNNFQIINIRYV
jgi:hypothetical protein